MYRFKVSLLIGPLITHGEHGNLANNTSKHDLHAHQLGV